jgi:hypothetical protein
MEKEVSKVLIFLLCVMLMLTFGNCEGQSSGGFSHLHSTLDIQYQALLKRPLEYFGYVGTGWEDEQTLQEMLTDNANLLVVDFGWLGGFLLPDADSPLKAKIDTDNPRFKAFEEFLQRCSKLGLRNLVGIITCTNFHEYPEWFRKLYPEIYALDAEGNPEPLLYEINIPPERKQFWTNVEHPILNDLRKKFAESVIKSFRSNSNIIVWGVDGETLYPPVPAERGFDQSKFALRHFREYLKLKYGKIDKLNRAWGTKYKDFEEVLPPRKILLDRANLDWHSFRIIAIGEYLRYLYETYKKSDGERFAFNWLHDMGLRDDELKISGCAPFIYAMIGDGLIANPIVRPPREDYNTKYFEMMTSFRKPVFSSQLAYFPRPWPGYMIRRQIYECLGLGVWGVGLVSWTWPEGYLINWGIKGTEGQREARKVFGELRKLAPYLDLMWPVAPATRIFISQSVWLMDGWKGSWDALHRDFLERQIPKRYIMDWQILKGELKRPENKILISLDNEIINSEVLKRIEEFVKAGGIFVIVGKFNQFDEKLEKARVPSFLKGYSKKGKFKNLNYYSFHYGAGEVIRVDGGYSPAVADLLESLFGNERGFQPVKIIKGFPAYIERERSLDTTGEKQDLAEDFSGHSSLGQLIIAPSDFVQSLSISTPTYWKKVEGYGLKMEVFLSGPKGEKIGERIVPPEEIKDNGWIEIVLNKRLPKGTKLYLRISPLQPLPPATIGWWSLKIDAKVEAGAFVDDKAVKGVLRRVVVKYKDEEEARRGVESFLLSDGVNMGVVLVNVIDEQFDILLRIDENLIPDRKGVYLIKEPIIEREIGRARGGRMDVRVSLSPYGTAFVYFERLTRKEEVEKLLKDVKGTGGAIGIAFRERASEFAKDGRFSKALASALRLKNLLFVSEKVERGGGIEIKITNSDNKPITNANLSIDVSPLFGATTHWKEIAPGVYKIEIDRRRLPFVYDYQKGEYEPYRGELRLRIKFWKDMMQGYEEISIGGD